MRQWPPSSSAHSLTVSWWRPIPAAVHDLLASLWAADRAAYVVGGSLRDVLVGRQPADWDLASDARPEELVDLLPGAVYENSFGTVAVRRDDAVFEITTFRSDHDYADFRRPHRVEFGDTIELDFETDEGKCTVRTQIRFDDGSYFDADVDYCKANLLEIHTDTLVWKAAE